MPIQSLLLHLNEVPCNIRHVLIADNENIGCLIRNKDSYQSVNKPFSIHLNQWLGISNTFLCQSGAVSSGDDCVFH